MASQWILISLPEFRHGHTPAGSKIQPKKLGWRHVLCESDEVESLVFHTAEYSSEISSLVTNKEQRIAICDVYVLYRGLMVVEMFYAESSKWKGGRVSISQISNNKNKYSINRLAPQ
jgi:hypothetical protein